MIYFNCIKIQIYLQQNSLDLICPYENIFTFLFNCKCRFFQMKISILKTNSDLNIIKTVNMKCLSIFRIRYLILNIFITIFKENIIFF